MQKTTLHKDVWETAGYRIDTTSGDEGSTIPCSFAPESSTETALLCTILPSTDADSVSTFIVNMIKTEQLVINKHANGSTLPTIEKIDGTTQVLDVCSEGSGTCTYTIDRTDDISFIAIPNVGYAIDSWGINSNASACNETICSVPSASRGANTNPLISPVFRKIVIIELDIPEGYGFLELFRNNKEAHELFDPEISCAGRNETPRSIDDSVGDPGFFTGCVGEVPSGISVEIVYSSTQLFGTDNVNTDDGYRYTFRDYSNVNNVEFPITNGAGYSIVKTIADTDTRFAVRMEVRVDIRKARIDTPGTPIPDDFPAAPGTVTAQALQPISGLNTQTPVQCRQNDSGCEVYAPIGTQIRFEAEANAASGGREFAFLEWITETGECSGLNREGEPSPQCLLTVYTPVAIAGVFDEIFEIFVDVDLNTSGRQKPLDGFAVVYEDGIEIIRCTGGFSDPQLNIPESLDDQCSAKVPRTVDLFAIAEAAKTHRFEEWVATTSCAVEGGVGDTPSDNAFCYLENVSTDKNVAPVFMIDNSARPLIAIQPGNKLGGPENSGSDVDNAPRIAGGAGSATEAFTFTLNHPDETVTRDFTFNLECSATVGGTQHTAILRAVESQSNVSDDVVNAGFVNLADALGGIAHPVEAYVDTSEFTTADWTIWFGAGAGFNYFDIQRNEEGEVNHAKRSCRLRVVDDIGRVGYLADTIGSFVVDTYTPRVVNEGDVTITWKRDYTREYEDGSKDQIVEVDIANTVFVGGNNNFFLRKGDIFEIEVPFEDGALGGTIFGDGVQRAVANGNLNSDAEQVVFFVLGNDVANAKFARENAIVDFAEWRNDDDGRRNVLFVRGRLGEDIFVEQDGTAVSDDELISNLYLTGEEIATTENPLEHNSGWFLVGNLPDRAGNKNTLTRDIIASATIADEDFIKEVSVLNENSGETAGSIVKSSELPLQTAKTSSFDIVYHYAIVDYKPADVRRLRIVSHNPTNNEGGRVPFYEDASGKRADIGPGFGINRFEFSAAEGIESVGRVSGVDRNELADAWNIKAGGQEAFCTDTKSLFDDFLENALAISVDANGGFTQDGVNLREVVSELPFSNTADDCGNVGADTPNGILSAEYVVFDRSHNAARFDTNSQQDRIMSRTQDTIVPATYSVDEYTDTVRLFVDTQAPTYQAPEFRVGLRLSREEAISIQQGGNNNDITNAGVVIQPVSTSPYAFVIPSKNANATQKDFFWLRFPLSDEIFDYATAYKNTLNTAPDPTATRFGEIILGGFTPTFTKSPNTFSLSRYLSGESGFFAPSPLRDEDASANDPLLYIEQPNDLPSNTLSYGYLQQIPDTGRSGVQAVVQVETSPSAGCIAGENGARDIALNYASSRGCSGENDKAFIIYDNKQPTLSVDNVSDTTIKQGDEIEITFTAGDRLIDPRNAGRGLGVDVYSVAISGGSGCPNLSLGKVFDDATNTSTESTFKKIVRFEDEASSASCTLSVTDIAGNTANTTIEAITVEERGGTNIPAASGAGRRTSATKGGSGGGGGSSSPSLTKKIISSSNEQEAKEERVNPSVSIDTPEPGVERSASTRAIGGQPASTQLGAFTKNLIVGSNDQEVQALQQFLNRNGFPVAQTGPGSLGQETTFFGQATAQALRAYQQSNNIPTTGNLDATTRLVLNAEIQKRKIISTLIAEIQRITKLIREMQEQQPQQQVQIEVKEPVAQPQKAQLQQIQGQPLQVQQVQVQPVQPQPQQIEEQPQESSPFERRAQRRSFSGQQETQQPVAQPQQVQVQQVQQPIVQPVQPQPQQIEEQPQESSPFERRAQRRSFSGQQETQQPIAQPLQVQQAQQPILQQVQVQPIQPQLQQIEEQPQESSPFERRAQRRSFSGQQETQQPIAQPLQVQQAQQPILQQVQVQPIQPQLQQIEEQPQESSPFERNSNRRSFSF